MGAHFGSGKELLIVSRKELSWGPILVVERNELLIVSRKELSWGPVLIEGRKQLSLGPS